MENSNKSFFKNLDVRKYISNAKSLDNTLLTRLGKVAGFSNTTPITKWLDNPDRELEKFSSLIAILKEVFGENANGALEVYVKTMDSSRQSTRNVLEYSRINKLNSLFETTLDILSKSNNRESKKWAKYYKVDADAANGNISLLESIKLANEKTASLEMEVFTKLIQAYGYYDLGNYDMLKEMVKTMEFELGEIEDDFIRNSYTSRNLILQQGVNLFDGEMSKSREFGKRALEVTEDDNLLSLIYMHLGHASIFESFDKANDFLNKSLDYSLKVGNERISRDIKSSLNFLHNYWSKDAPYLNHNSAHINDIQEVAFDLIRKGKNEEALKMIEVMNVEGLLEKEKGFNFFLKGLISNNKEDYYKSIVHYKNVGDKFLRNAPLVELQKLGENPILLEALRA